MKVELDKIFSRLWKALDSLLEYDDMRPLQDTCQEFLDLEARMNGLGYFPDFYPQLWASDCFVLIEDYKTAIRFRPAIPVGGRASSQTDSLLSLKLASKMHITAREVLALFGPKLTKFGRDNIDQVAEYIQVILDDEGIQAQVNRLQNWAKDSYQYNFQVFTGLPSSYGYLLTTSKVKIKAFSFSNNNDAKEYVQTITRQAENVVREETGIPRVGEGWIAETKLFREIESYFPDLEVIHHASPEWLGRQHLDVFIPALKTALEYHGLQHDQPVGFFGGQEAFEATQKRDARKRRLCKKHGIKLIHVRPGYDIEEIIQEIMMQD